MDSNQAMALKNSGGINGTKTKRKRRLRKRTSGKNKPIIQGKEIFGIGSFCKDSEQSKTK